MRVTHFIRRVWTNDGGTNRAVLDLCEYQARSGAEVALATLDDRDAPPAWRQGQTGLPRMVLLDTPGRVWRALGRLREDQVSALIARTDVLHLHDLWEPAQVALAGAARGRRVPYIQTPHGMLAEWCMKQKRLKKALYFRAFAAPLLRGAARVHLTARAELEQSRRHHPHTAGVVIPLVFDLTPYRDPPDPALARRHLALPSNDHPTLLYLSRLDIKKRPDLLLHAAAALRDSGLRFNLAIAGPSRPEYQRQIEQLAAQLGLTDRTSFLGMVPAELKPSLYAACDLFVLPTQMENFGFVYFESMACGTPLVTTKGTDTWRELEDSGGARIVGPIGSSTAELTSAIASLIQDRPRLRAMGQSGRAWVLENLDPSRIVSQYLSLYARLAECAAAPTP